MKTLLLALVVILPVLARGADILIYGGTGHRTFLGCLTCSEFDPNSVHNQFGPYGNQFSGESIFNHFSEYGSKFSTTSACNKYAADPPVLVDKQGGFYGRLTLNRSHSQAVKESTVVSWLAAVCSD
jgi:hypothetical protein